MSASIRVLEPAAHALTYRPLTAGGRVNRTPLFSSVKWTSGSPSTGVRTPGLADSSSPMLANPLSTFSSVDDISSVTRSEDSDPLRIGPSDRSEPDGPALHAKSVRVANISPGYRSI